MDQPCTAQKVPHVTFSDVLTVKWTCEFLVLHLHFIAVQTSLRFSSSWRRSSESSPPASESTTHESLASVQLHQCSEWKCKIREPKSWIRGELRIWNQETRFCEPENHHHWSSSERKQRRTTEEDGWRQRWFRTDGEKKRLMVVSFTGSDSDSESLNLQQSGSLFYSLMQVEAFPLSSSFRTSLLSFRQQ